jgi:hypothetical protein
MSLNQQELNKNHFLIEVKLMQVILALDNLRDRTKFCYAGDLSS